MVKIDEGQRKLIAELLEFDSNDHLDKIFKSADHMPVADVSRQEREQVRKFLKECDMLMVRLALAFHASREAQNQEASEELLHPLTGMWSDICLVLATPTLETVLKTDTHTNITQIRKLIDRLQFKKPHLSHGADESSTQRSKKPRTEENISTSNRFEPLAEPQPSTSQAGENGNQDPDHQMDVAQTERDPVKKVHVDPIYILITNDWPAYVRHLNKNVLAIPVKAKLSGEYMKITPANPDDYRNLTKHLIETNMAFHALMPKNERPAKVLIKGLPSFIRPEAIIADLVALGYTPMHVSVLKRRGPRKDPLPLFLATLKTTSGWEKIYEETSLLETDITIKSFRSTGTKQCYRCQGFGHSSHNCYMPPKCMKCALGHESRDCVKPKTEKAKCANCGGAHTSNWSGCPMNPKNAPNKKPENPYSYQAYLKFLRDGPRKTYVDAPVPKNPAWQKRNDKIYMPPKSKIDFPKLPGAQESDSEGDYSSGEEVPPPQPPRRSNVADEISPTTVHRRRAAEKRAAAAAEAKERSQRLRAQHDEITRSTIPGAASLSGFADAVQAIREFQELVNLPVFIQKLKELVQAIKEAPTDMDRAYLVMEKLQGLSEAFHHTK